MYKIKAYYTTGDSFGSEETDTILELGWENLDIAKANLQRIKEHYKFYRELNDYWSRSRRTSEVIKEEVSSKDWYYSEFSVKLYADNGNEFIISAPWCGYFETLHRCEIIKEIGTDDMSFDTSEDFFNY